MSSTGSVSSPGSGRRKPAPSAGPRSWEPSKHTAKSASHTPGIPRCWTIWTVWNSIDSCARTADELVGKELISFS